MIKFEDLRSKIDEAIIFDDDFMSIFMRDIKCTELFLHVILDRTDLHVINVTTQTVLQGAGRSVKLDVLAVDDLGRKYNIEIQRVSRGAHPRRARFNSVMLDYYSLERGSDFTELKDNYVIFITEHDVLKGGLPLYTIDRVIMENGRAFGDGSHIVYVNASHRDSTTALGRLMHDMFEPVPEKLYYPELTDRMNYVKQTQKGGNEMSGIFDEVRAEMLEVGRVEGEEKGLKKGREEGRVEGEEKRSKDNITRMLRAGDLTLDRIVQYSGESIQKVKEIASSLGIAIS